MHLKNSTTSPTREFEGVVFDKVATFDLPAHLPTTEHGPASAATAALIPCSCMPMP